jgi:hypothetical protein
MKKTLLAGAIALSLAIPSAQAALYNFNYVASTGTLAGTLDGILQGDNNTVIVSSILDFATFNGVPGPSLPVVLSVDALVGADPTALPTVTLDGSYLDLYTADVLGGSDGFTFAVGNAYATLVTGAPVYLSGASFGAAFFEPYVQANWSLTAVPVPATLPLLALGAAALGLGRRRRSV